MQFRHCNFHWVQVFSVLLIALIASEVAALQLVPRRVAEKQERTSINTMASRSNAVVVKFQDGLLIRARQGALTDFGTGTLVVAADLLQLLVNVAWEPAIALPEARLDELRIRAEQATGKAAFDFNALFNLVLPEGTDAEVVINALNALDIVELAIPMPLPAPPPLPPDFSGNQGYLMPASAGGIDTDCAWVPGILPGEGVAIADLEYSWNFSHLDLPGMMHLGDPVNDPFNNTNHGDAVMGEMFGDANGWGVVGISPNATPYTVATNTGPGAGTLNIANAIFVAINTLDPGDIIVIEQQMAGPNWPGGNTQLGLVPVEWQLDTYAAIVQAVSLGYIVIEAGGNGSQNLDAPEYSVGNNGHWPFLQANDSGAIIVGAGAAPGGSDVAHSRLAFSNYGSTVDLQGWGENIWSSGYGDAYNIEGPNLLYTSTFGGTSGATPIVAGVAALVQSTYKAQNSGAVLSPAQMKAVLQANSTPQAAGIFPANQNIGPFPIASDAIADAVPILDGDGNGVIDLCEKCLPFERQQFIAPSGPGYFHLGFDFDIDGDVAVAGANTPNDDEVYVYRFISGLWEHEATLSPSDPDPGSNYGMTVAIEGNVIVVGAPIADGPGFNSGVAYVYTKPSGAPWSNSTEQARLTSSDYPTSQPFFANHVDIDGDTIIVTASQMVSPGGGRGVVYIYEKPGGGWTDTDSGTRLWSAQTTNPNVGSFYSGTIEGDTIAVADVARGEVLLYVRPPSGWTEGTQTARLEPVFNFDSTTFGLSIDINGDRIAIGAYNQDNPGINNAGHAYIFDRPVGGWVDMTETAILRSDFAAVNDNMGWSVAVEGDVVLASAYKDDRPFGAWNNGTVYVFQKLGGVWTEVSELLSPTTNSSQLFGYSVELHRGRALIGATNTHLDATTGRGTATAFVGIGDCNVNGILDACEIESGTVADVDFNGIPDDCQDCDGDGVFDPIAISSGAVQDCNQNGIPDSCDIADGTSVDENGNGIPDFCEFDPCPADIDESGVVDVVDLLVLLAAWGSCPPPCPDYCNEDVNEDCEVNVTDLLDLLANWGICPP